jgi:hypothetical protein
VSYSSYFPVLQFVVQEKVFRVTAEIGSSSKTFDQGTEVPLRYLKSNPNRVVIQNIFYSFFRPIGLGIFTLIISFVSFKIYFGPSIDFPLAGVSRVMILPGAGIAMFFGIFILAIGLNMGISRLKLLLNGSINSGIVLESTSGIEHDETNFFGKKIKSHSKCLRILVEYMNPITGYEVQEEVIGETSSKVRPGSPLQFLKVPNEKSVNLDVPWFYISPLVILSMGWAFFLMGFALIKTSFFG